jgi:hypothetical protein
MRKILGSLALGILTLLAIPTATAGAQTTGSCSFTVSPTTLPPTGGSVTVSGTAPAGSTITIFKNGVADGTTTAADNGSWSIVVSVNSTTDITVSFGTNYPPAACLSGGAQAVRVNVEAAAVRQLAFTGSSNTGLYVFGALAAITVGAVLVVAARRRHSTVNHSS